MKVRKTEYGTYNENFFNEDNELTFYWAGYIASKAKIYNHHGLYELSFSLPIKEKEILENFKIDISATDDIKTTTVIGKNTTKYKPYDICYFSIFSKDILNQLKRFEIKYTKILKNAPDFPDYVKNNDLRNHYMRGYFDGFASLKKFKEKEGEVRQHSFLLRGKGEFLEIFQEMLETYGDLPKRNNRINKRPGRNSETYFLDYGGNQLLATIKDYLYKDATRYYSEKYNIVKNVVKTRYIPFNKDFFKEDSEKSFYWAGFLAADGSVSDDNYLTLAIDKKDLDHLLKYRSDLGSEHKVSSYRNIKSVTIGNSDLVSSLGKFNIVPRKSLIYKMPDWLLNHKYVHHFIRGYFDGDGSVSAKKDKNGNYFVSCNFLGTYKMMEQIEEIIRNHCNILYRKEVKKHKTIFVMSYGGNNICANIRNFLYKDATIYLDRKRERMNRVNRDGGAEIKELKRKSCTKEDLIWALENHSTLKNAALYLGKDPVIISKLVKKHNLTKYMRKNIHSHFSKENLEKEIIKCGSIQKLAEKHGYTKGGMRYILKKFGIYNPKTKANNMAL